jgi:Na+/alanine symporter
MPIGFEKNGELEVLIIVSSEFSFCCILSNGCYAEQCCLFVGLNTIVMGLFELVLLTT